MAKDNQNKKESKNDKKVLTLLIAIIVLITICCTITFVSAFGFIAFMYSFGDSNYDNFDEYRIEYDQTDDEVYRKYIDPEIDEEAEDLYQKGLDNFIFVYSDSDDYGKYDSEEKFILTNIQYEYERLSSIFEFQLGDQITILFTDDQQEFENRMGFDYQDELAVAGNTLFREVQFYIHPDKVHSKEALYEIISHELVHLFQVEGTDDALYPYPRWFSEGTAEYFSNSDRFELGYYSVSSELGTLTDLNDAMESGIIIDTQAAYNLSYYFIDHLIDIHGEQQVKKVMFPNVYEEEIDEQGVGTDSIFTYNYFKYLNSDPITDYMEWHMSMFE